MTPQGTSSILDGLTPAERVLTLWFFNLVPRLQRQGRIPADVRLVVSTSGSRCWVRQLGNHQPVILTGSTGRLMARIGEHCFITRAVDPMRLQVVKPSPDPSAKSYDTISDEYNAQDRPQLRPALEFFADQLVHYLNLEYSPPQQPQCGRLRRRSRQREAMSAAQRRARRHLRRARRRHLRRLMRQQR